MRTVLTWQRVIISCALLVAVGGWGQIEPVYAGNEDVVANEVVMKLNPAANTTIAAINAAYGTTTIKTLTPGAGVYLLRTPARQTADDVANRMAGDKRVLYSEPNFRSAPPEANPSSIGGWGGTDPAPFAKQYAASMLRLGPAHAVSRGAGAVVAVIDTGVRLNHPALANRFTSARFDFVDGDGVPDDAFNRRDDDGDGQTDELAGHGTHVAALVRLVAPDAKIMPLRVLDSDGQGNVWSVVEAINYAARNGAHVINLSLGTAERSRLLEDTITTATQRGVLVVAAVGNENTGTEHYPAADQCVVGVTAIGATGKKAAWANYGDAVDVAAPGEQIYSAFPPSGYAWWSGTSMASPFVAGQAALIRSAKPALPVRDVAMLIATSARSLDAANPQFVGELGAGQIDVGASLERLAVGDLSNSGSSVLGGGCSQ